MSSKGKTRRAVVREISLEEYEKMRGKRPASRTGHQAQQILIDLKPNQPILLEDATRGLQAALSRRINRDFPEVEMKVEKFGERRNVALLKRGT